MYIIDAIMSSRLDPIAYAYSGQDGGASLPYFVGKQYGNGWLRTLARIAFPILKKVVGFAGNVASNTAEDMINNKKSFRESLKDNALGEAQRTFMSGKRAASFSSINTPKKKRIKSKETIFASS